MVSGVNLLPKEENASNTVQVSLNGTPVKTTSGLVLCEKRNQHRRGLHYMIEVGGTINLNGLFGVRFLPVEGDYLAVQLVTNGMDNPVRYNIFAKSTPNKKVGRKKKVEFKSGTEGLF